MQKNKLKTLFFILLLLGITVYTFLDNEENTPTVITQSADNGYPTYSGQPYVIINDGLPFLGDNMLTTKTYEYYGPLDELGRCTLAEGIYGLETMPGSKRGDISSVKPTGWHSSIYPEYLVEGSSLYNRCHLVAYAISGEEANPNNLVTGTRYFNESINDMENLIIDYIRDTGNHVFYRVTPIFSGDNLICDGQLAEAYSIEDQGEGICFCVYCYNVQPGIVIDYLTGDNYLAEDVSGHFILNTYRKKIHSPDCEGVNDISKNNVKDYNGSYNDLLKQGYEADRECNPLARN